MEDVPAEKRAELLGGTMAALRFTIWAAEHGEWAARAGDQADMPQCPVTEGDLPALALPLAFLVIAARRALAEQQGITGSAGQAEFARGQLQRELENLEMFSALEAGFAAG